MAPCCAEAQRLLSATSTRRKGSRNVAGQTPEGAWDAEPARCVARERRVLKCEQAAHSISRLNLTLGITVGSATKRPAATPLPRTTSRLPVWLIESQVVEQKAKPSVEPPFLLAVRQGIPPHQRGLGERARTKANVLEQANIDAARRSNLAPEEVGRHAGTQAAVWESDKPRLPWEEIQLLDQLAPLARLSLATWSVTDGSDDPSLLVASRTRTHAANSTASPTCAACEQGAIPNLGRARKPRTCTVRPTPGAPLRLDQLDAFGKPRHCSWPSDTTALPSRVHVEALMRGELLEAPSTTRGARLCFFVDEHWR